RQRVVMRSELFHARDEGAHQLDILKFFFLQPLIQFRDGGEKYVVGNRSSHGDSLRLEVNGRFHGHGNGNLRELLGIAAILFARSLQLVLGILWDFRRRRRLRHQSGRRCEHDLASRHSCKCSTASYSAAASEALWPSASSAAFSIAERGADSPVQISNCLTACSTNISSP